MTAASPPWLISLFCALIFAVGMAAGAVFSYRALGVLHRQQLLPRSLPLRVAVEVVVVAGVMTLTVAIMGCALVGAALLVVVGGKA